MFTLSIYYKTCISSYKGTNEYTSLIIGNFYMFLIRLWYDEKSDPDIIGIKWNIYDKTKV